MISRQMVENRLDCAGIIHRTRVLTDRSSDSIVLESYGEYGSSIIKTKVCSRSLAADCWNEIDNHIMEIKKLMRSQDMFWGDGLGGLINPNILPNLGNAANSRIGTLAGANAQGNINNQYGLDQMVGQQRIAESNMQRAIEKLNNQRTPEQVQQDNAQMNPVKHTLVALMPIDKKYESKKQAEKPKENKGMFGIKDDIKAFIHENKGVIGWVLLLALCDHLFLGGAMKAKLQETAGKFLGKVNDKIDSSGHTPVKPA